MIWYFGSVLRRAQQSICQKILILVPYPLAPIGGGEGARQGTCPLWKKIL